MAKYFNALSPDSSNSVDELDGIDVLFGGWCCCPRSHEPHSYNLFLGHDHFYYVSQGFPEDSWDEKRQGASKREAEGAGLLILKSGTNFYDMSELTVELSDGKGANVKRKKVIRGVKNGKDLK